MILCPCLMYYFFICKSSISPLIQSSTCDILNRNRPASGLWCYDGRLSRPDSLAPTEVMRWSSEFWSLVKLVRSMFHIVIYPIYVSCLSRSFRVGIKLCSFPSFLSPFYSTLAQLGTQPTFTWACYSIRFFWLGICQVLHKRVYQSHPWTGGN
jgi:hypothetical protein